MSCRPKDRVWVLYVSNLYDVGKVHVGKVHNKWWQLPLLLLLDFGTMTVNANTRERLGPRYHTASKRC